MMISRCDDNCDDFVDDVEDHNEHGGCHKYDGADCDYNQWSGVYKNKSSRTMLFIFMCNFQMFANGYCQRILKDHLKCKIVSKISCIFDKQFYTVHCICYWFKMFQGHLGAYFVVNSASKWFYLTHELHPEEIFNELLNTFFILLTYAFQTTFIFLCIFCFIFQSSHCQ